MKNKFKKIIGSLIIVILSIVSMLTTALAVTSSSPYETPTIYGHKYSFTSEVWERNDTTVEAVAFVKTNTNVPIGYMGANARLYNPSGYLQASSGTVYNTSRTSGLWAYSSRISTPGQYYAHSTGSFYNGNGYNTYTGYKSPIYSLSSSTSASVDEVVKADKVIEEVMTRTKYAVNDNGETYGSALSAYTIGVEPDLISAIGINGIEGYVRSDELTPKITTIEEALEQMGNNGDVRTISLYDVDGTTTLGEFELITSYKLITDVE